MITRTVWCTALLVTASLPALADTPINQVRPLSAEGTVSIDNVEFRQPVEVGQLVSLHASVNYVGRTSLVVGIRVEAENVETGEVRHTNTSYFTMVCKSRDGAPQVVPPLLLESPEDARRFMEAIRRKTLKTHYKDDFDNEKTRLQTESTLAMLHGERCTIGY